MPGLAGTTAAGNNVRMRNLLSFLAGSLGSITQYYYMQDPNKLDAWDDYKTYAGKVRALKPGDVNDAAKEVVRPDNLIWLVVGDRAKIEAGVRELNYGEFHLMDTDGKVLQ